MNPALLLVFHELLRTSEGSRTLTLDVVSAAIGTVSSSAEEVDALFAALEAEGRAIEDAPEPVSPSRDLGVVLAAVRQLTAETGAKPSLAALATRTGLSEEAVGIALRFASVMAR